MKTALFKRGVLLIAAVLVPCVQAVVSDPAKSAGQYSTWFALFRSANMASPDKLSTGIGFHSFRIPAVVTTATGRVIAFAEGRRNSNLDYGDINLVYKRTKLTTGGGKGAADWEGLQEAVGKGSGTWGNPTPVVDGSTIYLFMSWNAGGYSQNGDPQFDGTPTKKIDSTWEGRRHLYLSQSTDDGQTWSDPQDLTTTLTPDGWAWDAVGPGHGIVLKSGELVIPAKGRNIIGRGSPGQRTWSYQSLAGAGSEGTIAQTFDGNLYRNDRATDYRSVARGSLTSFSAFAADTGLPDPGCEGSTLLYNLADSNGPARLLFLNSADTQSRRDMRVRITYDSDAGKFDYGRKLSDDPISGVGYEGGYSCMTKTDDFKIGALVETDFYQGGGKPTDNRAIVWRRVNLSWILNGPNN